jgi:FKBP-type peptidyl-prolyl cis-trans isomerase 2
MAIKKGDFVELEFIGRNLGNNEVFDTNVLEEAKKANPDMKEVRPLVICVGQGMVVKGFDESLEGKEIGKKYALKVEPEKAFGKRYSNLIKLVPMKFFLQQKIYPQPGMTLALDDALVKVISVSGGRVMVDFNNPLAGKEIEYEFTIKRTVEDARERANSLQRFFFGQEFEFDVDETSKKIVFNDLKLAPIMKAFAGKFKEMLGYDVEIFEKKKEEKEADRADTKKKEDEQEKDKI